MGFNGSGTWIPPSSPGAFNPAVSGQQADPTSWNALLADIASGLSTAVCRDGQSTITANLPMAGYHHTNVGAATALSDYASASQVVNGSLLGFTDTGAADAYVITPSIAITSLVAYQHFVFIAQNANATTTPTLAVSGLTAKVIVRPNGAALAVNDITAGGMCDVVYDGANHWILLSGGTAAINNSLLTTRGDMIARSATVPARLAIGSNHTVLKSNGTDPAWGAVDLTADVTGVLPNANFALSSATNALSGDVDLSNTGLYFTGPTVAQGSTGTWLASGTVTLLDTAGAATFGVKLWDGTTVIASAAANSEGASIPVTVSLSGYLASPAGNIRISVNDGSSTSGKIKFNLSGNSKDSVLSAIRIA